MKIFLRKYQGMGRVHVIPRDPIVPSFDPNEWCLKNGLHSWGLNPGPLGHESSANMSRL